MPHHRQLMTLQSRQTVQVRLLTLPCNCPWLRLSCLLVVVVWGSLNVDIIAEVDALPIVSASEACSSRPLFLTGAHSPMTTDMLTRPSWLLAAKVVTRV